MKSQQFENLLGKPLSVTEMSIGNDFENKLFGNNFYYINDDLEKKNFYGIPYNCLTILTNEKNLVQSITVHLHKIINYKSYSLLVENYGIPNTIKVIKSSIIDSEDVYTDEPFRQKLREKKVKLREGKFEEAPLFIIWNKKSYQIKAFLRHEQNISEISFTVSND